MGWLDFIRKSSGDQNTWLVAGLGNYGDKYRDSRHNAGFVAADALASARNLSFRRHKCRAATATYALGDQKIVLAKPLTYMNKSGEAVAALMQFYKVPAGRLIVIYDDIDLPLGALRVRPSGGPGTHNGMRNIVACLGEEDFARVRVGVGAPPHGGDLVKYVLGAMPPEAREAAGRAAQAAEDIVSEGLERAMTRYNGKNGEK